MISNSLTFALGPKFLDCPDDIEASSQTPKDPLNNSADAADLASQEEAAISTNEQTSLLPQRTARTTTRSAYSLLARCQTAFSHLPAPIQQTLTFLSMFLNPPFIGTCLGALIGLVPTLHTLFFSPQSEGGYLNAWLTAALKNVGDLFAALQVIVVGIKLSSSLLKWKKGACDGCAVCFLACGGDSAGVRFCYEDERFGGRADSLVRDDVDADGPAGAEHYCYGGC
jgi:hypothetical protein